VKPVTRHLTPRLPHPASTFFLLLSLLLSPGHFLSKNHNFYLLDLFSPCLDPETPIGIPSARQGIV
jgi:hypothetical protein